MPNWCLCNLGMSGSKKDINKVLELISGSEKNETGLEEKTAFDFNKVLPMPPDLIGTISPARGEEVAKQVELAKKHGYGNWYDWRLANWGTKWNPNDVEVVDKSPCLDEVETTEKEIHFATAWSPPLPIVEILGKKFTNVLFVLKYFEPDMLFAGEFGIKGDSITRSDYKFEDPKYKEIAEFFNMA